MIKPKKGKTEIPMIPARGPQTVFSGNQGLGTLGLGTLATCNPANRGLGTLGLGTLATSNLGNQGLGTLGLGTPATRRCNPYFERQS